MDTICSATQDRQDAMLTMLAEGGLDVMVVIGGYNSSNTQALARICAAKLPTFHIDSPESVSPGTIRHRPIGSHDLIETADWLPAGAVSVGLTAGASTPNNVVGEVVARILGARGLTVAELGPALSPAVDRRTWPVRAYGLGAEPPDDLSGSTTGAQRLAMMWPLAVEAWALTGQPLPEYARSEISVSRRPANVVP
jgi:hypothetical protein